MRTLIALALLITAFAVNAQTNDPFETWKQWISGKYPVKSVLIQNTVYNTNETTMNVKWFRFGLQDDTHFFQDYIDNTNSTEVGINRLVPMGQTRGASGLIIWEVMGELVTAETLPNHESIYIDDNNRVRMIIGRNKSRIQQALSGAGGFDHTTIEWDNLKFRGKSVPFRGERENISGYITEMTNGAPAEYWYWYGTSGPIKVHMKYSTNLPPGVPAYIRRTHPQSGPMEYTLLRFDPGTNDLRETDGYVPSVFTSSAKYLVMFTNALEYSVDVVHGESFLVKSEPDPFAKANRGKLIGLAAMVLIGLLTAWMILRPKH